MNKTAKRIFQLLVTARNLRRIPRSTAWGCYFQTPSLHYSSDTNTKDNWALWATAPSSPENSINDSIWKAKTKDEIFEIVTQHHSSLKSRHAIQAIKMLYGMYMQDSRKDMSISTRAEFLQLCEVLINDIKSVNENNAAYLIRSLSNFGVPDNSVIMEMMLQVVRSSLNQLTLQSLMIVDFELKSFKSTPLADALKIAIPIMCEFKIKNKMIDTSDITELMNALLFLTKNPEHHQSTVVVINSFKNMGNNIYVRHAPKIFKYLCDLKYLPPGYEEVLLNMQQIMIKNTRQIPCYHIRIVLGKLVKKVTYHGDKTFYSEEFVDACAKAVISEDHGFEEGVHILRALENLRHTQIRLIDYLAAKCFENPMVLKHSSFHSVMTLIIGLAIADYKPIFWESMQEILLENIVRNISMLQPKRMYLIVSMAVLDCFHPEIIRTVFNEHFLRSLLSTNTPLSHWYLLLFYQSVKLLYPNYEGPWPSQCILEAAIKANGPSVENSSLLPSLEKAMGGPHYVLSNLKSKLGHHIDHAVVMRKGGYPVAVNSLPKEVQEEQPNSYIENLQLPAESQVIMVINLPATAYSINSHRLTGHWSLLLKTLEIQTTHTVIPISSTMWNDLMDREKIPYLMQAIRLKCDSLSASANA